ncbi:MAG: bifunctional folylpolyglutamate synthase/dihydrofolate synthase [Syntrophomonadaceae bacterium]|nr:bifunctional folylpolyglutamate synthase/dihydrofolate synthase [Syntrophomonadaceae bacterium]
MGSPEQGLKYVHVGGTNGKGSTSHIVEKILEVAEYKVGRFTSPHIHSYLERFTINGERITAQELQIYINDIEELIKDIFSGDQDRPTEFELLTALAFKWFKDKQVDIAVMEVGMGGLYDSTNVIIPEVSIITSIALDHMSFLGDTIEEVAFNKAGIIKSQVPIVVGKIEDRALKVIENEALAKKAPLFNSSATKVIKKTDSGILGCEVDIIGPDYNLSNVFFSLPGDFQLENLVTALTAISVLINKGFHISNDHIKKGLAQLKMPGRLEVVKDNPLVIVDVAHNPHAARAVNESLTRLLPNKKRTLLCGIVDDKDAFGIIKELGQNVSTCIITKPEGPRGDNWLRLKSLWQELYPDKLLVAIEDIEEAVGYALDTLNEDEYLLICGSFYILDKARRMFTTS